MRVSTFPDKEIAMLRVVRLTIFCLILITATIHVVLAYPAGLLGFYIAAAGFFLLAIVYVNPTHRFTKFLGVLKCVPICQNIYIYNSVLDVFQLLGK